ncbi:recombinase family protein [bacterium]|nr:MAG: recombinase family protein [bacterium]
MTTALIYVRQSRHKDTERTVSPEVQENACRSLPAVAVCDSIEVYSDLDVSGGKLKGRARFLALLERIQGSSVAVVACYDQSRAFRNTQDALTFYALMEKRPDIKVAFVHGRFDRTPAGEFTYTAMAAAHSMERRMTGEKIRAAYAYRNAQGAATGPAPYGYRRTTRGTLEVVEPAASVVRRVFQDYATGMWSARSLAARLNDEGIVKGSRHGLGWLPDTLVDILRNPAYVGKTYSVSRRRREGELIRAEWPAIVDEGLFVRVQATLKTNAPGPGGAPRHDYVFSRLLVCASCGRLMRAMTDHNRVYYLCRRDLVTRCGRQAVREEALLPWASFLFERLDSREGYEAARAATGRVRTLPGTLERIEDSLKRLKSLYVRGLMPQDEFERELAHFERLRAELAARATPPAPTIKLEGLSAAWKRGNSVERRKLLLKFFARFYVRDGRIDHYVPRADRVDEVEGLVSLATGGQPEVEVLAPIPQTGRSDFIAKSGAGGI